MDDQTKDLLITFGPVFAAALFFAAFLFRYFSTPFELRYTLKGSKKAVVDTLPSAAFSQEMTFREKLNKLLKPLIVLLPVFVFTNYWLFPKVKNEPETFCSEWLGLYGFYWYWIYVFVIVFLCMGVVLYTALKNYKAIKKAGQCPLPNEKTVAPIQYKYGKAALIKPSLGVFAILFMTVYMVIGFAYIFAKSDGLFQQYEEKCELNDRKGQATN